MSHKNLLPLLFFIGFLSGCLSTTSKPIGKKGPAQLLTKTHGQIQLGQAGALHLSYKSMQILCDAGLKGTSHNQASSLIDYLLLTQTHEFLGTHLRKNLKILTSPQGATILRQAGFNKVKSLENGQRVLLQKKEDYLFVNNVMETGQKGELNSYFLEFDNGRNLFVVGEMEKADSFRSLLYDLRDDGKEIHMVLITVGIQPAEDETRVAEIVGLLQPDLGVLIPKTSWENVSFKEALFQEKLEDQLFNGDIVKAKSRAVLPF